MDGVWWIGGVERGEDSVDWDRGWMVMVDMFMVGLEYCLVNS